MVIKISGHSAKSFKEAAKQVLQYRDKLADKNELYVSWLCDEGIKQARGHLSNVDDKYDPPGFETEAPHAAMGSNGNVSAVLSLIGEQAAFVEFGAGIHYNPVPNSSTHPLGVELGFTIGSYGAHQGLHEEWTHKGETYQGTPAAMPLFHAKRAIEDNATSIARKAFRS